MSAEVVSLRRKWISMPGGSCDVRMGSDALEQASKVFSSSVGRPKRCMVMLREHTSHELRERLRRQLVDAGFEVGWHEVVGPLACTIDQAALLSTALAHQGATGDDLCCAFGDADVLSMAAFVCGSWCGGMPLVTIPLNEIALLEGALVPRALDVAGIPGLLSARPSANRVLFDYDLALSDMQSETSRHARVLMVAAAMAGSEREFSALWDRADAIMAPEDDGAFIEQLLATAKTRGQTSSSTAAAVRQSLYYGQDFACTVDRLTGHTLPFSELLGEGLRFAARVSVMLDKLSLDDMLAQDELLEMLDIGTVTCNIAPQELCDGLRAERFLRTNRFMLLVPLAIGRVRLTTIEDELLMEHASAWCDAHKAERLG